MVCQKNEATEFDFMTEGIRMLVDGDWVRAEGTTLGADNGIGVASILAVLESSDIEHPALEALFTIDEETGMTGALGLQGGFLSGDILLNLDTEDDDEISIGCAGGVDLTSRGTYSPEQTVEEGNTALSIVLRGRLRRSQWHGHPQRFGQRQQTHEPRPLGSPGPRRLARG